ncbi:MAG: FAD binding domain-containing protein [Kiloniellaceae bacterium]
MKPAPFDYARPASLDEALDLLAEPDPLVKILAGGQTLGPMLNLRLVQPDLLVDVTRIPDLLRVEETDDAVLIGACVTHAAIEDGRVPDPSGGLLREVARGIAYRAVRTRGTLGGSLAHADPAADWITCLAALEAEAIVCSRAGRRSIPVADFMAGVFETVMAPDEILEAVRIPKLAEGARCGFYKVCRKTGEFAEAIGAVLHDPARGICRAVVGATHGAPIVLVDAAELFGRDLSAPLSARFDRAAARRLLAEKGFTDDPYEVQVHTVALERAVRQVQ